MGDFKGTPGPWNTWMGTYIENDAGSGVCEVFGDLTSLSEDQANANLIAASPELLEALCQLRDYVEGVLAVSTDNCHPEHPLIRATSVISKALGQ